jgi:hypothetical protein
MTAASIVALRILVEFRDRIDLPETDPEAVMIIWPSAQELPEIYKRALLRWLESER